jgi:hypothetical protein
MAAKRNMAILAMLPPKEADPHLMGLPNPYLVL